MSSRKPSSDPQFRQRGVHELLGQCSSWSESLPSLGKSSSKVRVQGKERVHLVRCSAPKTPLNPGPIDILFPLLPRDKQGVSCRFCEHGQKELTELDFHHLVKRVKCVCRVCVYGRCTCVSLWCMCGMLQGVWCVWCVTCLYVHVCGVCAVQCVVCMYGVCGVQGVIGSFSYQSILITITRCTLLLGFFHTTSCYCFYAWLVVYLHLFKVTLFGILRQI